MEPSRDFQTTVRLKWSKYIERLELGLKGPYKRKHGECKGSDVVWFCEGCHIFDVKGLLLKVLFG